MIITLQEYDWVLDRSLYMVMASFDDFEKKNGRNLYRVREIISNVCDRIHYRVLLDEVLSRIMVGYALDGLEGGEFEERLRNDLVNVLCEELTNVLGEDLAHVLRV